MADRNALLKQIQQGKKLKKAVTNDRSAPAVGKASGGSSNSSSGGIAPPMGMARPPIPPSIPGARSNGAQSAGPAEPPKGPPPGMPGLGGLFTGGMPKLRHRSGGVNTGRGSESDEPTRNSTPPAPSAPVQPPPQMPKSPKGSKFTLPFRRNSHARSSSSSANVSTPANELPMPAPVAPAPQVTLAKAPPPPLPSNRVPPIPGRRLSDSGSRGSIPIRTAPPISRNTLLPPSSLPGSRPGSSLVGKKAPPPPPSSRKPQIRPKPPGLTANRHSPSPSPQSAGTVDLRNTLRPVSSTSQSSPRASITNDESGVVEERHGSVSSLAGIFGQSVKSKAPKSSRPLSSETFSATLSSSPAPAPAPAHAPPPPPPSAIPPRLTHQRASSASAQFTSHPPLPPMSQPPLPPPARSPSVPANGNVQDVPVREGKWTFHSFSEIPPPPIFTIKSHHYPSGNARGSAIPFDI